MTSDIDKCRLQWISPNDNVKTWNARIAFISHCAVWIWSREKVIRYSLRTGAPAPFPKDWHIPQPLWWIIPEDLEAIRIQSSKRFPLHSRRKTRNVLFDEPAQR